MFYGWKIVGVTWFCHFITAGFIFYSYGIFLPYLTEELHGGRQAASWSLAYMSISTSLFAPFLGHALDHRKTRNIMAIGTIALGVGFIMASRVTTFWQFNLLLASFVGLGAAACGGLPCTTLVANWFVRKRGKALGISTMGVSFSGVIMAPVTAQLIALIGWRNTFAAYGYTTLGIILPVVWYYVVRSPEDIGLTPDGMPMNGESVEADEPVIPVAPGDQLIDHPGHLEWSTVTALRDRNFWVINTTVGLCFFCMGAILTHLTAHLIDLGFSAIDEAPFIVATCAGTGVIGKLLFGWVADHIETRVAFWIAILFLIVGTTLILFADTLPEFFGAAGVYGFGMGGIVPLYASLIGDAYGRTNFGRIMGLMSLTMLPVHIGGLPFAGWVYDQYLNYDLAYKTFIAVFAVSACILAGLRKNGQNGNGPSIAPE